MMVRDMAKQGPRGVPHLGPAGWFGLQDGGASSVVCGHDVLMRIVDYMRGRGLSPDRFLFMPTNKTFGFGGDASRQADWLVRLPREAPTASPKNMPILGAENEPSGHGEVLLL